MFSNVIILMWRFHSGSVLVVNVSAVHVTGGHEIKNNSGCNLCSVRLSTADLLLWAPVACKWRGIFKKAICFKVHKNNAWFARKNIHACHIRERAWNCNVGGWPPKGCYRKSIESRKSDSQFLDKTIPEAVRSTVTIVFEVQGTRSSNRFATSSEGTRDEKINVWKKKTAITCTSIDSNYE